MADNYENAGTKAEAKDAAPAEKEVTSSVKDAVKETNGAEEPQKNGAPKENGSSDNGEEEEEKEEDQDEEDDVKENGDSDACTVKRKSCSGDVDPTEVTPEKKQKLVEEDGATEEAETAEA